MILHPGILALLVGTSIAVLMCGYACLLGLRIMSRWDFTDSSSFQLQLERRTYLVSALMSAALSFEIVSAFLFIYTVDDIHRLFVGAMCATGTLNANPVGWYALAVKILVFFVSLLWIVLNRLDQRSGDFPVIRVKYAALLLVAPLLVADLVLQARFFLGLQPEIITSCCGSLFSSEGQGVAAGMTGLPLRRTITVFFSVTAVFASLLTGALVYGSRILRVLVSLCAAAWFGVSVVSVVSFISLYIYELPTHHCPFDIFQKEYSFVGYPLYAAMFFGAGSGLLPGVFAAFRGHPSLDTLIRQADRRWILTSLLCIILFTGIVIRYMAAGSFTLEGYF